MAVARRRGRPCEALRGVLLSCMLMIAAPGFAVEGEGREPFAAGLEAYRAGDYETALRAFLAARDAGVDTPNLTYNLGVTYYRLELYGEARRQFRDLADHPELGPIAEYNLGLIAERTGDRRNAVRHLEHARDGATDNRLRALAEQALARLEDPAAARPARYSGFLGAALGYDTNVTLSPDADLVGVADNRDTFLELYGGLRGGLGADRRGRFELGLYAREYNDVDAFDELALRGAGYWWMPAGGWQLEAGGIADHVRLDGDNFQNIATLHLQGLLPAADYRALRLRYRLSRIQSASDFEHLTGWRQQAEVSGRVRWRTNRVRFGYRLEYNNRDDLDRNDEFFSHSAIRNEVFGRIIRPLGTQRRLVVDLSARRSRYRDSDRIAENGISERRRRETRYRAGLRFEQDLTRHWLLFAAYDYTRNNSNMSEFDYRRHQVMLGGEAYF